MKERISKLLTIKSLITLILTLLFAFVIITGAPINEQFMMIFTTVIAFYFGTQAKKE